MEIQRLISSVPGGAAPLGGAAPKVAGGGFGQALGDAVQSLDALQKDADAQGTQLAAGEPVELHDVMLSQDRASLSMQLAVQVRNKMVEAYQEIMRMQV